MIELAIGRFPFGDYESSSSSASSHYDEGDEDEENENDSTDVEERDDEDAETDDETEAVCRGVTSVGSSLLTVKPSEKTARQWVEATTKTRKRRSKEMSVKSYDGGMSLSIIELMHEIVKEPAPRLSDFGQEKQFPVEAEEFVDACLLKDPEQRKTPGVLLVSAVLDMFSDWLIIMFA